jgi:helix-turn-helix protein
MPRPERALDVTAGPLPRFAADLRELRREAGGMPYRQMARAANYSATVLSEAAAGRRLPTLAVTLAYVAACGGDEEEWRARWHALATEVTADTPPDPDDAARYAAAPVYDEPSDTKPSPTVARDRRIRLAGWLAAVVVVLLAAVTVLTIRLVQVSNRPAVPVAPGGAMPEHMVPFNAEVTEGNAVDGEPPSGARCSTLSQAAACVDIAHGLVWVRDLPPGDGHHAAGYWTTTDGAVHGECHNYLTGEGPWATCPLADLPAGARLGLRTAVVEKYAVLIWGPYQVMPTGQAS